MSHNRFQKPRAANKLPNTNPAKEPVLSRVLSNPTKRERAKNYEDELTFINETIARSHRRSRIYTLVVTGTFILFVMLLALSIPYVGILLGAIMGNTGYNAFFWRNKKKEAEKDAFRVKADLEALKN